MMNSVDLSKWAQKGGRTRHSLCDLCCMGSAPCVSPLSTAMDGLQPLRVFQKHTFMQGDLLCSSSAVTC